MARRELPDGFELDDDPQRIDVDAVHDAEHFNEQELANLILTITAINAWNKIAISSGTVFTDD